MCEDKGRIRYGLHQQNPDVDKNQELMRMELERFEEISQKDPSHFSFNPGIFKPT